MNRLFNAALLAAILVLAACSDETTRTVQPAQPSEAVAAVDGHTGTVVETMNAGGYTYLHVDTGDEQIWAAAPETSINVGDEVWMPEGMPMRNFHSESLDRGFEVLYFVDAVNVGGAPMAGGMEGHGMQQMPPGHPNVAADAAEMDFSDIEKVEGGFTIGEIFEKRSELAGRDVAVRGKVVKFNSRIMGTNWIHIQDGSGGEGANDLTVSTGQTAEIGDAVVVRGVLGVDKDFGYGYTYAVIVEDAEVTIE